MHRSLAPALVAFALAIPPLQAQELSPGEAVQRVSTLYQEAQQALQTGDTTAFVRGMVQAEALRPGHQTLMLQLAYAHAVAGDTEAALDAMARYAEHGFVPTNDLSEIAEFEPLMASDAWGPIATRLATNEVEVGTATEAYRLDTRDFVPEGIALDTRNGDFYLGSVHRGEIVRLRDGVATPFAGPEDGLWAAMGMRLDAERNHLWVATTAAPNFRGYDAADEGRAAVLRFDLSRPGSPATRFERDDGPHWYGDLVVSRDGTVYVSDSGGSAVYRITPGSTSLDLLVKNADFPSPQGIDLSTDGHLYLADYATGLFRIDPETAVYTPVEAPEGTSLLGIDGLYVHGGHLIAVQNGIRPHRVVRLEMSADRTRVVGSTVLEMNRSWFAEPTLGTVVGDDFYFVANSQWFLFDEDGGLPPTEEMVPPLVVKRNLASYR